ncbi:MULTISPECIES: hypothetical protein [unclassified Psychrobacter]|uniref:hypothetical protein n=1 Tax=unclassified Psychrobacter TaxID=196806 RepID=UPI0025CBC656|nr:MULTISPECIES: hypothetical protein [unclassified Psychrobacter]
MGNPNKNRKKWLTLSTVGMALLLIPRRSSKKADRKLSDDAKSNRNDKVPGKVPNQTDIKDNSALK